MLHFLPINGKPRTGITIVHTEELLSVKRFTLNTRPAMEFNCIVDGIEYFGTFVPSFHHLPGSFEMAEVDGDKHAQGHHKMIGERMARNYYYNELSVREKTRRDV